MLFEPGSATRRVIDSFFVTEKIEPTVVMETENVEIIKAMVATGLGISIVPYQAVAREVRAGQFFCSRIEGQQLVRETGWVYARANRVPRMVHELQVALDADQEQAGACAKAGCEPHRLTAENRCNFELTGYGCSAVGVD